MFIVQQRPLRALYVVALVALLVRVIIGANFPYSGRATPPMFGDFEAQRHWLEITHNVPLVDWYRNTSANDLQYWGLDYPPLTAYHSWALAQVAARTNPALIALTTSRGHESDAGVRFMRYTVLVADVVVFFSAVLALLPGWHAGASPRGDKWSNQIEASLGGGDQAYNRAPHSAVMTSARTLIGVALVLANPALMLVDHGHFQYNCICLGLMLWAVHHLLRGRELLASAFFVASMCYKQMALYYAPAFFCVLAGRAWHRSGGSLWRFAARVTVLGVTVVLAFALCFAPIVWAAGVDIDNGANMTPTYARIFDALAHVLHRVFPFARGLFEDKVSNFWCVSSVVFRWKERFAANAALLVRLALGTTCTALALPAIALARAPTAPRFLVALFAHAFAFFLFSFQVHEKTVLLPLTPLLVIAASGARSAFIAVWLSVVATFSMYPLLFKDGLALPYAALQITYTTLGMCACRALGGNVPRSWRIAFGVSMLAGLILHAASALVAAPARFPDVHTLACCAFSFAHFATAFAGACYILTHRLQERESTSASGLWSEEVTLSATQVWFGGSRSSESMAATHVPKVSQVMTLQPHMSPTVASSQPSLSAAPQPTTTSVLIGGETSTATPRRRSTRVRR